MKKIHTTMIVGLMISAMVLVAGCKREYGTVTLGANIADGRDTKVYIDDLTPCWHNNDLIRVNNQTCTTSAALGSSAQITDVVESNHYRAIYPADIVGDVDITSSSTIAVTLPRVQQYEVDSHGDQKVKVPMGAYSSNESLTFHNLCSVIKVVVSSRMENPFLLDSIRITASNAYLSGLGSATVMNRPSDAVEMMASSSSSPDVSLTFTSGNRPSIGRGDRDTYVYYIVAPEFAEDNVIINLYSQGSYATFEKSGVALRHNRIATVSLTVEQYDGVIPPVPPSVDGVLPGAFSVSETRQIHFSQGNLQYRANTNTWRFAEHQWDFVGSQTPSGSIYASGEGTVYGSDNINISSTYIGWIDLFGWGTSGWNSGAICYQPWSTSTSNSDYYHGESYTNGLTGAYAEADWAYHNAISNGGNATHLWRTLTHSEWNYLINNRADASAKCSSGNINGVGGLIILPDNWILPTGCSFISGFPSISYEWGRNSYTFTQWAQMESAGAVFLPAAGFRRGTNIYHLAEDGCYWSSAPNDENSAYGMDFHQLGIILSDGVDLSIGISVRPVRDVE